MIPIAVAGVQVKSHKKSHFAHDVNPFHLGPILQPQGDPGTCENFAPTLQAANTLRSNSPEAD